MKKTEAKRQKQEELRRQKERFAQEQNEILEKARREMLLEHPVVDPTDVLAQQMATTYLASIDSSAAPMNYEDLAFLYKVILTPDAILTQAMYRNFPHTLLPNRLQMQKPELASFYRKNAARIHPDKCRHPQAIEAFQKFTECYRRGCAQ